MWYGYICTCPQLMISYDDDQIGPLNEEDEDCCDLMNDYSIENIILNDAVEEFVHKYQHLTSSSVQYVYVDCTQLLLSYTIGILMMLLILTRMLFPRVMMVSSGIMMVPRIMIIFRRLMMDQRSAVVIMTKEND